MTKNCNICGMGEWDVCDEYFMWLATINAPNEVKYLKELITETRGYTHILVTCLTCGYNFPINLQVLWERLNKLES